MQKKLFILLTLFTTIFAGRNEMARDYFAYKNVSSVIAFLCEKENNNFEFEKMLNKRGISVAILYSEFKFSLKKVMSIKYSRCGVFLDLNCGNWYSEFILEETSKLRNYDELYNWLLFGKSLNESIKMLYDDTFSISTDLVIATPKTGAGYSLYDVYNHGKGNGGRVNVTELASWHEKGGLNVTLLQQKYQRRANFHGMKIDIVAVTQYRPDDMRVEDYLQDYSTRPLDSMSKFAYIILLGIADIFNLTLEITETSFWDQIDTDGTHLGMVGILQRSEADLGSTPAIMSRDRATLIQLIGPVWPFRTCFMFRSIPSEINDEFIRPFDMESWIVTGIVTIICTIALGLTFKAEFVKDKFDTWSEAVVVITSIICQQGTTLTPKYISSRMVVIQILFFGLLIYNYYSASIVSAQLNLPRGKMNDSLHQLAKSNLEIAAEPVTYTNFGFVALTDWETQDFYIKRWKPLSEKKRFMPLEEGFAKVAKSGFAYHTDPNTGYPYIERLFTNQMICELTEVHLFHPTKMALWGKRDSPFTKIAKIGLTKISSSGILSRQMKRWASRKPVCFQEAFIVQSVTILTTAPMFIILCIGIVLSSIIFALEIVIAKRQNTLIISLYA